MSGEKKHITVLFADVAGSMDLQERLDAEVWAQIMGRFVSILAEGVRKYGGTVDKFTGDGIMALFGAPVAQEDHARRACHAAWHLTKAIGQYSQELQQTQGVELQVRLGLNSGEVVVGRVGDDVTLDPTALGHTVGLAERMEAMAEPGKAYLTGHTARLVEASFRLEDLGEKPVKGSTEPVRLYALGPPMSRPVRRTVGAAPLLGRERELAVLEDALVMASEGQFQVVGVVGEAGVGKSRLCEEFGRSVTGRGIALRRATGVSHGRDIPLLPILSFHRDYFEITDADDPATARGKVTDRLLDLDPGLDDVLPLVFDFLEVPDPDRPAPPMAAEVRMRRIFDVVHRVTARRSERETLVLIFEDLHWFDAQSEAFLERLIESYPGSRTLVVTNFRPEFSARWMRHSYYCQLPLAPLRTPAVRELLGELLGADPSLAPLVSFVLHRTGGNPFFVEELIRALVEDGSLSGAPGRYRLTRPLHEIRVPPSVQAVLAARIDRLPAGQKAVLETASVIGRTFDPAVLAEVAGSSPEPLENALSALCTAELIQPAGEGHEYRFWHPLTQEVAYGTVLSSRRAELHTRVAETLVNEQGTPTGERAGVIAWHWERAGRRLEAARWLMEAGNRALRTDLDEAQRQWRAVIELLTGITETPESLRIGISARARLFQYGARTGVTPAALDRLYSEARSLAERLGDRKLLAWVVGVSGATRFWLGELHEGFRRWTEGAALADETDDSDLCAMAYIAHALPLTYIGPLSEAIMWADHELALCGGDPDRGAAYLGYSALARALDFRARALLVAGRLPEAARDLEQSLALARERAEPDPLCWALSLAARLAWTIGEGDASDAAAEAVKVAEETGNTAGLVLGLESIGLSELGAGRFSTAVTVCERALFAARKNGSGLFEEASVLAYLAAAQLAAGDPAGSAAAATEAVAVARRQQARVVECLALIMRARARRAGDCDPGLAVLDLEAADSLVMVTEALTYKAFIREELGRLRDDNAELQAALHLYHQIGATGHARRLDAEIAARPVG